MQIVFFFFKQKTAYEMRISDWSSDVCSSDLEAMSQAAAMSNRDRLFQLLSRLLGHCGVSDSAGRVQAQLPLSREDLAGMLGVRQETLSRLLKRLKQEGVIDISGRHCQLLSLHRDRKSTRLNSSH